MNENARDTAMGFFADCMGQMMAGPMQGMMLGGGLVLLLLLGLSVAALLKSLRRPV